MVSSYRTTRAAELDSLARFRDFVDEVCRAHGIDAETAYDLKLAVDEACTNVVQHGYKGMNSGSIMLDLNVSDEEVEVRLTDFGHPFEPSSAPKPDISLPLHERPAGGFGLFFIYETMDAVDYVSNEEGNTLILRKHIEE
ncbi:MAG TPA: ATP-binding protein [Candidatus Binatia bacterium]|jgi:serine/threonine-protein kinase RsbW|nr:ATP-binding protein [Candidatus Binatia bacterium]